MPFFLNRIKPKYNESLYSLLYRLAKANYFEHHALIFREYAVQIYRANLNYIKENMGWATSIGKIMSTMSYDIKKFTFNNPLEFLQEKNQEDSMNYSYFFHNNRTKYCPLCLENDFYHRLNWDLSLATVCLEHKIYLIDKCPGCNSSITLFNLMQGTCKCESAFLDCSLKLQKPSDDVLESQKVIQELFFGEKKKLVLPDRTELLAEEYFFLLINFCLLMEGMQLSSNIFKIDNFDIKKLKAKCTKKDQNLVGNMTTIATIAHFLVAQPGKIFPELLKAIDEAKDYSVDAYYRRIMKRLVSIVNSDKRGVYVQRYQNHLQNLKTDYVGRRKIIPFLSLERKLLTGQETTILLKTGYDTVLHLCELGLLKSYVTVKEKETIILIEKESVELYMKMKQESISLEKVRKYLGLRYQKAIELVHRNIITPIHGPSVNSYEIWYFKKDDIVNFMSSILKQAVKIEEKNEEWLSFNKANQLLEKAFITTVDLIELVVKGHFKIAVQNTNTNFRGIFIAKEEIEEFLIDFKKKRMNEHGYTIKEICKILRVGEVRVRNWLEEGKLSITSTVKNTNGVISRFISRKQIEKILFETHDWTYEQVKEYLDTKF